MPKILKFNLNLYILFSCTLGFVASKREKVVLLLRMKNMLMTNEEKYLYKGIILVLY